MIRISFAATCPMDLFHLKLVVYAVGNRRSTQTRLGWHRHGFVRLGFVCIIHSNRAGLSVVTLYGMAPQRPLDLAVNENINLAIR